MTAISWEAATIDGPPPHFEVVKAFVVDQLDSVARKAMHRAAGIWVGKRDHEYLVLQCERAIDRHRVHGRCMSSMAAYLLRGQLEALQRGAREKGEKNAAFRRAARMTGVLLPTFGRR